MRAQLCLHLTGMLCSLSCSKCTCALPEGGDQARPLPCVLLARDVLLGHRLAALGGGPLHAWCQVAGDGRLPQLGKQRGLQVWRVLLCVMEVMLACG